MRSNLCLVAVLFSLSLQLLFAASGGSNSVQANVMVICPFSLSSNALSVYTTGNDILLNYTVFTRASCDISHLQGSFTLEYSSNDVAVLSTSLNVNTVTQNSALYQLLPINSLALQPGGYRAVFDFATYGTSNESAHIFVLVSPINITVQSFAVSPASVSLGSTLAFSANIINNGQLASGPISTSIVIAGPQSVTIHGSASALSPGQSEMLNFVLGNVTGAVGSYTAGFFATFTSGNAILLSNLKSTPYQVVQPPAPSQSSGPPPPSEAVATVPKLSFSEMPFYSSLTSGSSAISNFGFGDTSSDPITVNFSVPRAFSNILGLSTYKAYLLPGENLLLQLFFNSGSLVDSGTYVVPLNISVSSQNGAPVSRTQFLTYVVSKSSTNVSMYNQISTLNNTAVVTTTLVGAANTSLTNSTLVTRLPGSVVSDASQVKTYGLPATVTAVNSSFGMAASMQREKQHALFLPTGSGATPAYILITWLVPYLPAGKSVTLSYTINNPRNIGLLPSVQNLLVVKSQPATSGVLKVVSIGAPTFYTDSVNKVTVGVLYTGTSLQDVKFTMTTTGTETVINPVQFVNASPNQLLQTTFNVRTGNTTGTDLFALSITALNATVNYTLPVFVMQKSASATTTIAQAPISGAAIVRGAEYVAGAAAIAIAVFLIISLRKRPRYKAERAKELIRLREQIKRSDEHG